MNPSDYRRDYAAYRSAVERERYRHHAGLVARPDLEQAEERYADLWTREAIDELRRAYDETPEQFETERAGLRALAGAARLKYLEVRAQEVTQELGRCEASGRISWGGAEVAASDAPGLVAFESDAVRRRELAARWFDAVRPCEDLRAARLEALNEAARELGFDHLRALHEDVTGVDLEALAAAAELFLERTARAYSAHLSRWAARHAPRGAAGGLHYADELFFERAAHLDVYFPAEWFGAAYAWTLAGLGVRAGGQRNVKVDAEPRPSKKERSACFAVEPPKDVRLVVGARGGGAEWARETFREAGRAQSFGWASGDAAARYPEFVYAPDGATAEGHALLFAGLLRDAAWLGAQSAMRATEAEEVTRTLALLELHDARRDCAGLRYWLALSTAGDVRSEQLKEAYLSSHADATGFRYDAATHLLDAERAARSATRLRARLFAASSREHLRARHGRRWYASRAAGDELIDVWNTASRYTVEELARLAWGGELSFDLLADELLAVMGEGV